MKKKICFSFVSASVGLCFFPSAFGNSLTVACDPPENSRHFEYPSGREVKVAWIVTVDDNEYNASGYYLWDNKVVENSKFSTACVYLENGVLRCFFSKSQHPEYSYQGFDWLDFQKTVDGQITMTEAKIMHMSGHVIFDDYICTPL